MPPTASLTFPIAYTTFLPTYTAFKSSDSPMSCSPADLYMYCLSPPRAPSHHPNKCLARFHYKTQGGGCVMLGLRSLRACMQTQMCHFFAVQLLASDVTSLGLSFLVPEMRMTLRNDISCLKKRKKNVSKMKCDNSLPVT